MATTLQHIAALAPSTRMAARYLVYIGRYYGLPVIITSSRRSQSQQDKFVAAGVSLTRNSRHLFGQAFDIDMSGFAPDDVPLPIWQWMGELGEALGLRWGGRWLTIRDFRHFER